jgi:hypothetical protein
MTDRRLTQLIAAVAILNVTFAVWTGLPTIISVAPAAMDTASGSPRRQVQRDVGTTATDPVAATSTRDDQNPPPDATADYTGGNATRLRTADDSPLPGDVFMLMATAGSDAHARLYDETPYTHDRGVAADTHHSNLIAVETVEAITGRDVDLLELTTAPGGGSSAGIAYAIAYLNIISDGAFTGDVRVAATGRLGREGYVHPITAIDEKTAAAHHAAADVLFTPSTPTTEHLDLYSARHVGELFRVAFTDNPLAEERQLDLYHSWGATQPDGLDVVGVRHIADVAAYLCGAGSSYACTIVDQLDDHVTGIPTAAPAAPSDTRQTSTAAPIR